jgi:hypothetical protein
MSWWGRVGGIVLRRIGPPLNYLFLPPNIHRTELFFDEITLDEVAKIVI